MKILAGAVQPGRGRGPSRRRGRHASPRPQDARRAGIGIVYQELSLFPERSILANLFPDRQPTRLGLVDRAAMRELAAPGPPAHRACAPTPTRWSGELGPRRAAAGGDQPRPHRAARGCSSSTSPTPRSTSARRSGCSRSCASCRPTGMTMLYVSHRLEEVFEIADRITVMRNGRLVWTRDRAALTIAQVVEAMVGVARRELFPPRAARTVRAGQLRDARRRAARSVRGLTVGDELRDVSFDGAAAGEIIGLAGPGGLRRRDAARRPVRHATSDRRARSRFPDGAGAPRVPDRRRSARRQPRASRPAPPGPDAGPEHRAQHRAGVRRDPAQSNGRGSAAARCWTAARRQIDRLRIKASGPGDLVGSLSGGNQQKVVVGKWLEVAPSVMLLDDPTRGVDVGAKREIYRLIRELADEGRIVLFRSTELPELVGLADRILVLYRGRLDVELARRRHDGPRGPARHQHRPSRSARAGRHPGDRRRRSCHDPPRLHDAPQARRARRVQAAPRPDLAGAGREIERQGIAQHHDLRGRPGPVPLLRDRRRGGLGPAVAHRDPRPVGGDHEPADGVQRRRHRRLERAARGVPPRDSRLAGRSERSDG